MHGNELRHVAVTVPDVSSSKAEEDADRSHLVLGREVAKRMPGQHLAEVASEPERVEEASVFWRQLAGLVELDPRALD